MTLLQMAKGCKKVWQDVLKSKDGAKPVWATKYMHKCPACSYVNKQCMECPLLELWGYTKHSKECPCQQSTRSPYRKYYKTSLGWTGYKGDKKSIATRKECAKKIIAFVEKKFKV